MILKVHSDGSYLLVLNSRSRAAGYYYMGDNIPIYQQNKPQEAIYVEYSIIKLVVASAAECEMATLFLNCQNTLILQTTVEEIGYKQPPTPIQVDNPITYNYVYDALQ